MLCANVLEKYWERGEPRVRVRVLLVLYVCFVYGDNKKKRPRDVFGAKVEFLFLSGKKNEGVERCIKPGVLGWSK